MCSVSQCQTQEVVCQGAAHLELMHERAGLSRGAELLRHGRIEGPVGPQGPGRGRGGRTEQRGIGAAQNFSHNVCRGLKDQGFLAARTFLSGAALTFGWLIALFGEVDPGLHLGEVWQRVM